MSDIKQLFQSKLDFSLFIETKAIENGASCYQTLLDYCEEHDIEIESVASSVSPQLKDKLAVEFAELGMLKASPSLIDD